MKSIDINFVRSISEVFDKVDGLFTSDEQRESAKLILFKAQHEGTLDDITERLLKTLAEANTKDLWISRARPGFLYVMYTMILVSVPIGLSAAISADTALAVAAGMKAWLGAIPDGMWATFGAGYLGYAASRTADKIKAGRK